MSVYTKVETVHLESFLARYELGRCKRFDPVPGGITNTNYFLDTEQGRFVLTLYEHHGDDELDYMLGLQQHLAAAGVNCSAPVKDRRGALYSTLNQRPAAINRFLDGDIVASPGPEHCALIGTMLARFHLCGKDFSGNRPNPRALDWLHVVTDMLADQLTGEERSLVAHTLQEFAALDSSSLPAGAIHADLFHDNALFTGHGSVGIVDFDYACKDIFIFDLAVVVNDWCIDKCGQIEPSRAHAFVEAYQRLRPLDAREIVALPLMLRVTALRFWLSRLQDKLFPLSGELTYIKDPGMFRDMLLRHTQQQAKLEGLFLPQGMG